MQDVFIPCVSGAVSQIVRQNARRWCAESVYTPYTGAIGVQRQEQTISMSSILNIETSTNICSVSLSRDGLSEFSRRNDDGGKHGTLLGTYVDEALEYAQMHDIAVDAVCVSKGPGSYTPLLSVPTLEVMCVPLLLYKADIDLSALLCPMIDARRMEVYSAIYDSALHEVRPIHADIVTAETYLPWLDKQPVYFFGNGSEKCKEVIHHPNAHFVSDIVPDAKYMFPLAEKRLRSGETEDVAYFTPFYLKDFVAKPARDLLHPGNNG